MGTLRLVGYPFESDLGTLTTDHVPGAGEIVTLDGASYRVENIEWTREQDTLRPTVWLSELDEPEV
ncbi:MAG: hypothetical protein M3O28_12805 [Actinomycetota bacterium]|nr:hypothetical protein [Actinomycetota bacterium]